CISRSSIFFASSASLSDFKTNSRVVINAPSAKSRVVITAGIYSVVSSGKYKKTACSIPPSMHSTPFPKDIMSNASYCCVRFYIIRFLRTFGKIDGKNIKEAYKCNEPLSRNGLQRPVAAGQEKTVLLFARLLSKITEKAARGDFLD